MKDEIVEELHKYREEYAKKFNYDLNAIFEDLKRKEAESGRKYVSFSDQEGKNEDTKKAA
jgi:hypothetical protein